MIAMKLMLVPLVGLVLFAPAEAQLAAPNEAGVAMGHVHLNVHDVEAQRKFWIEQFAAVPLRKEGLQGVKIPGMLILFRQQAPTGSNEGTMMDHFGLKVPNTAEVVKRCRAGGYQIQREFKGTEGFPNAYIFGPDEVKVEIQEDTTQTVPSMAYHLHFMNGMGDQIKLMDWYAKTFSAAVKKRGQHDAADIPGMNLTFGVTRNPPTLGTKGRSIDHIGFEVKNLEAFCKNLEANGVKLDVPYRKVPSAGIAIAFLTDPFGTYVELTEGLDKF
jgi:catechol 2,3-dioxygenase-like lactoylglutathione lyase family enzyme